jgi:hypothetical protein
VPSRGAGNQTYKSKTFVAISAENAVYDRLDRCTEIVSATDDVAYFAGHVSYGACTNYINLSGAGLALILGGFAHVYLKTGINKLGKEEPICP